MSSLKVPGDMYNRALSDVPVSFLLNIMKMDVLKEDQQKLVYAAMIDECMDRYKFTFGKYKNRLLSDIVQSDAQYVKWLVEQSDLMKKDENKELKLILQGSLLRSHTQQ